MKSSKGKTPANGSKPIKKGCPTPGKPSKVASRPKDPVEVSWFTYTLKWETRSLASWDDTFYIAKGL